MSRASLFVSLLGCVAAARLSLAQDALRMEPFSDRDHFEGDSCKVNLAGRDGVCKKVTECPEALQQIKQTGKTTILRCGFDNYTEIVCCPSMRKLASCPAIFPAIPAYGFGGVAVVVPEFPYIVALGYKTGDGVEYSCGGTLITKSHVLTAAHCVHNRHKRVPVVVLAGALSVSSPEPESQLLPVQDIAWHPEHRISRYYNDLAIIRMASTVRFSPNVLPIYLPRENDMEVLRTKAESLTVAGWGKTDLDAPLSNDLIKIQQLSLADRGACAASYTDTVGVKDGLADYMICVTDRNVSRKADTCPGDSGGPLLMVRQGERKLIGVTSFGQGCGGSVPGVYTAIPPFLDWIRLTVCKMSEQN